ncbi:hypothetical protein BOO88_26555 [Stutzerimonas stutzeri]|nr:hypothetical protein BOO89_20100 [Stutzerimonas stutzeri]AZO92286.1 hypothetical protein BOO88_26555 [Stutzerimonas stutzeri]
MLAELISGVCVLWLFVIQNMEPRIFVYDRIQSSEAILLEFETKLPSRLECRISSLNVFECKPRNIVIFPSAM